MKYGTAKWIVKPWDRKSLSYYVPDVKDLLEDKLYVWNSSFEGTCVKYFFVKPSETIIPENIANALSVDYMTKDTAIAYLRTDTNMPEVSEWKFEINPEIILGSEITPASYIEVI